MSSEGPGFRGKGSAGKQNPLVTVVLLVVIVISLGFIVKNATQGGSRRPEVLWACEACSVEFAGPSSREPARCPGCGGEAVRLVRYYCEVHGHVFDAYVMKPEPESFALWQKAMEEGRARTPETALSMYTQLYKVPGGEWTEEPPATVCCPDGNCDPATLLYQPLR